MVTTTSKAMPHRTMPRSHHGGGVDRTPRTITGTSSRTPSTPSWSTATCPTTGCNTGTIRTVWSWTVDPALAAIHLQIHHQGAHQAATAT